MTLHPIQIAPSLLSANFARLEDDVRRCEAGGAEVLHVDVMDGHFVPNITIGPLVVEALRPVTKLVLDCHLMIAEPDRYIGAFANAGADWISIHVEATKHLHRTLSMIREHGKRTGAVRCCGILRFYPTYVGESRVWWTEVYHFIFAPRLRITRFSGQ
jgi:ribulose-phosphate 3-epimerase